MPRLSKKFLAETSNVSRLSSNPYRAQNAMIRIMRITIKLIQTIHVCRLFDTLRRKDVYELSG